MQLVIYLTRVTELSILGDGHAASRMPLKVTFSLEVNVEVILRMRSRVVLLKEFLGNEELGTLLAFKEFLLLICRQLQQVFIC